MKMEKEEEEEEEEKEERVKNEGWFAAFLGSVSEHETDKLSC